MFKILKDQNTNVSDMAKSYIEIEAFLNNELEPEQSKVRDRLMQLQQAEFSGQDVSRKIKQAKAEYEGTSIKVESCQSGLKELKERMAAGFSEHLQKPLEEMIAEYDAIDKAKQNRFRDMLKLAAKCVAIQVEINWRDSVTKIRTGEIIYHAPDLKIEPHKLEEEDRKFFVSEFEKEQQRTGVKEFSQTYKCRLHNLSLEITEVKTTLENLDPAREVDNLLDGLRGKDPATETTEPVQSVG